MGALAHDLLGLVRIVPDGRVLGEAVQLVEAQERLLPVKETSSAVPSTA